MIIYDNISQIPRRPEIWSGVIQSTNQTDSRNLA